MADDENKDSNVDGASQKAQERIRALSARIAELEGWKRENESKIATADALTTQLQSLKADHEKAAQGWATEKAILAAGISDPEGVDFARVAYERVQPGQNGQRPDIASWLANKDALPRAVRAYLAEAPANGANGAQGGSGNTGAGNTGGNTGNGANGQAGAGNGQGGNKVQAPNPNNGAKPYTGAPNQFDAQSIQSMTPEQYRANREAIFASVGATAPALRK